MRRDDGWRVSRESSAGYYGICTVGGMLSSGATHLVFTPLDVLKVNMQVDPIKYSSITSGLSFLWKEQGPSSLWRGWSGKLFGYGIQGGCKFGLYEYFKMLYSDSMQDRNRSFIYFLSAASAQVFADVALCPFEGVKVRVQAQPGFAKGLADGFPKVYRTEGLAGFYKGLFPLWGRNLPFSMVMFSSFEHSVDLIYKHFLQRTKEECSRMQQLGVTCFAGYSAGAVSTIVSNPADNVVSSLYNRKADSIMQAVKNIGLFNLFTRSLPVRIAIVGPLITSQWFLYDTIKVLNGLLRPLLHDVIRFILQSNQWRTQQASARSQSINLAVCKTDHTGTCILSCAPHRSSPEVTSNSEARKSLCPATSGVIFILGEAVWKSLEGEK